METRLLLKDITGGAIDPMLGEYADLHLTLASEKVSLRVPYPLIVGLIVNLQQARQRIAAFRQGQPGFSDVPYLRLSKAKGETVAGTDLALHLFDPNEVSTTYLLSREKVEELRNSLDRWLSSTGESQQPPQAH